MHFLDSPPIYSDMRLEQSPVASPTTLSERPKEAHRWAISRLGDDTIRTLRYCISFLKYAIDNMSNQLLLLKQGLDESANGARTIMSA
jgi:hypothetical protein